MFQASGWGTQTPFGVIVLGCLSGLVVIIISKFLALARPGFGAAMKMSWTMGKERAATIEAGIQKDQSGQATTIFMIWHLWAAIYNFAILAFVGDVLNGMAIAIREGQNDWIMIVGYLIGVFSCLLFTFRGLRAAWRMNSVYRAAWPKLQPINISLFKLPVA